MADDDKKRIGDISVTLGNHNRVGDIGHKVYAPIPRHFGPADRAKFLQHVPKTRMVRIFVQSTAMDGQDLANEIRNFMTAEGYELAEIGYGNSYPPSKGIVITLNTDHPEADIDINIGPQD